MNSSNTFKLEPAEKQEVRLDINGPQPSVTRVSRKAVLLAGVCGGSLGLVVLLFAFGDHAAPRKDAPADENAIRPTGPIESVKNLPQDYSFNVDQHDDRGRSSPRKAQPLPTTVPAVPLAQDRAVVEALRQLADQRQKAWEQQQKDQQAALDSPLVFGGAKLQPLAVKSATVPTVVIQDSRHGAGSENTGNDQSVGGNGTTPSLGVNLAHQQQNETFLTQSTSVEAYLTKPVLSPGSKYELKAGSVIAGALVTAINTDLPGEVIGQVTENIYDTAAGDYLLIPQGAKLLGKYQSLVSNGQNRALLVWQRLIFPNGKSIALDGMPGTDESGASGLSDKVDYHLDKLAEATTLTTTLAYAGNAARNPNAARGNNGQDVIGDTVAQQANRVGEKVIDRELDVQPTITIRQGWPLRVLVNKDMILEPYIP